MDKKEKLKELERKMAGEKGLPLSTNLVFGEGDPDAKVLFVGEAPGREEDIQGRPFVGRGGKLLTREIEVIGWSREEVYITNIVKRRPPDNRDPLPEEIEAYAPYLVKQIEILNPIIIVPLGRFSMNFFLTDGKITRDQGKVFRIKNRFIVPMLHPAAALRSTRMMEAFIKTFKKLPSIVTKCEKTIGKV